MVSIRFRHILDRHRIRTRTGRRRELQTQSGSVFFIDFQYFQLFKHLHAALHLQSFGISAFETLDKVLRFSNKLLLLVVCLLLLLAAFLAHCRYWL